MMNNQDPPTIETLLDIMARLRDPEDGCPWDVQQSFATIAPYTIEEAYEVADAIVHADTEALRDELGDLLFQVVFHAQMAEEGGHFRFADVVESIVTKMIRRHPHVFADDAATDAVAVKANWEAIKARERAAAGKAHESALDGVAAGMAPLLRARKLQQRAAAQGFDWPDVPPVMDKLREEMQELEAELDQGSASPCIEAELGDLLFTAVNLARHLQVDPELALTGASARFEARFRHLEREAAADGGGSLGDRPLQELESLWRSAKRALLGREGRAPVSVRGASTEEE